MLVPGAAKALRGDSDLTHWAKFHQPLLRRNVRNLKQLGYVTITEEDGQSIVRITNKGKREVLKYDVDKIEIKRPENWDRQWRVIIFDIPNEKKNARDVLRRKLKELEFYQLQESVFIFPFPCEKEIKFLRELYEVTNEVKIIIASKLDNETELRKMFKV